MEGSIEGGLAGHEEQQLAGEGVQGGHPDEEELHGVDFPVELEGEVAEQAQGPSRARREGSGCNRQGVEWGEEAEDGGYRGFYLGGGLRGFLHFGCTWNFEWGWVG